ncbi:hypothetical protein XENTR_v10007157 [Xenopus tropicalis]|nr:hypothetical protein XENTR_v10007157 [Xenopus tropicalis]
MYCGYPGRLSTKLHSYIGKSCKGGGITWIYWVLLSAAMDHMGHNNKKRAVLLLSRGCKPREPVLSRMNVGLASLYCSACDLVNNKFHNE